MRKKSTTILSLFALLLIILLIGCGGGTAGLVTSTAGATALYSTAGYTETGSGFTVDVRQRVNSPADSTT